MPLLLSVVFLLLPLRDVGAPVATASSQRAPIRIAPAQPTNPQEPDTVRKARGKERNPPQIPGPWQYHWGVTGRLHDTPVTGEAWMYPETSVAPGRWKMDITSTDGAETRFTIEGTWVAQGPDEIVWRSTWGDTTGTLRRVGQSQRWRDAGSNVSAMDLTFDPWGKP